MSGLKNIATFPPLPETRRGYGIHIYATSRKDGDWFAYTNGRHVVLRSLSDPRVSRIFSEHKAKVNVVAFSPNGEWVASGDDTGRVLVWGFTNFVIKNDVPAVGQVLDIAWDSEGKRIAAVGNGKDTFAKVFSWDSGNNLGTITGHTKAILSCSYKSTRPFRLITSSEDLSLGWHSGPPFKFEHTIKEHQRYPNRVLFSPDGEFAVSVGADSRILVLDGKTGQKVREIVDKEHGHKGSIYSFAWSPDGKALLTASADRTAKLWDFAAGNVIKTFNFSANPGIGDMQVAALWHKEYVVTVSLSGAINFLDLENPDKPKRVVHGHKTPISSFALDRNSKTFFTGDVEGQVAVWRDGEARWLEGAGHAAGIRALALSADGAALYSVGADDRLRVNAVQSGAFNPDGPELNGTPVVVAVAKKSGLAVVGLAQNKLVLLDGDKILGVTDVGYKPAFVDFSLDDSQVAVGGEDKKAHFYVVDGGKLVEKEVLTEHVLTVTGIRYAPDGSAFTTASKDKGILVYKDGKIVNPSHWEFHTGAVQDHRWSPSGHAVASVSNDLTIFVFLDTKTFSAERKEEKMSHRDGISFVDWLENDVLLTVGDEGAIKTWGL